MLRGHKFVDALGNPIKGAFKKVEEEIKAKREEEEKKVEI